jgi:hypothetical protein
MCLTILRIHEIPGPKIEGLLCDPPRHNKALYGGQMSSNAN